MVRFRKSNDYREIVNDVRTNRDIKANLQGIDVGFQIIKYTYWKLITLKKKKTFNEFYVICVLCRDKLSKYTNVTNMLSLSKSFCGELMS